MKGRPPKPTAVKHLQGTYRADRANPDEPRPPRPARAPYALRFLNEEGKKEWRRMVGILIGLGLYTEVDRAALAMYCHVWGIWVEAVQRVDRTGGPVLMSEAGNLYQNPWQSSANKAFDQLKKMLPEFGLTPSARSRIQVAPAEEVDELEALLFRRDVRVGRG